ncbi:hypothetical protein PFICI_14739 [Pestalotiopsis fici W106-1]|uniref:Uncharacterized protein n=1 Tax=Pestalotiopsis fici (strain W106-1 / CGMCC3.15140) TaxID=1229662 RepID=W3WIU7_PESFW|nr:uncharacterized protein PFICI_14739 [Pestalotiopsis fici W106-1]ETS73793.1 hypothetical protein PFICI_14739 [Pestalotiopsis fici W106-1]
MDNLHPTLETPTIPLHQYAYSPSTDSPISWPASIESFNAGYNSSESLSTPMTEHSSTFGSTAFEESSPATTTAMYTTMRSSEPPTWTPEYWMAQNSIPVQGLPTDTFPYHIPLQVTPNEENTSTVPILSGLATKPTEAWAGYTEETYARHGANLGPYPTERMPTLATSEKGTYYVPQLQNLSPDDIETMSRRWAMTGLPYATTV